MKSLINSGLIIDALIGDALGFYQYFPQRFVLFCGKDEKFNGFIKPGGDFLWKII